MGFVTLGLFLFDDIAILGSIYQLLSHGFISAAYFSALACFMIDFIQEIL